MAERILQRYRTLVASGELKPDAAQGAAVVRLQALEAALREYRPRGLFSKASEPPKGLYLWGDVGRGKSMLMDLFFSRVPLRAKRRVHFNAFMVETHTRIHEARQRGADDPIPIVAKRIAEEALLLCFDEFQVADVADAMILGRLFERLFELGVVVVATSNTPPRRLYEGGLNRQLFLPFIALIEQKLGLVELNGPTDYRLQRLAQIDTYITPLCAQSDSKMDTAWLHLTDTQCGASQSLTVLGRRLCVPQAARGVARFTFDDLCRRPLAAPDYLEVARHFHTLLIDRIPVLEPADRNEARRFILLVDTLYDEQVKLVCSAAASPEQLYPSGDGAEAFRRTASRLREMQSAGYLGCGRAWCASRVETFAAEA
ncbi:MAG: AFG1 family ATPase [Alphaproteobacteria bacterium]|nr:AFG1 family ATPase [Alphaproteobacteria bacterium]